MNLVKYPAHADDWFLVTSREALEALKRGDLETFRNLTTETIAALRPLVDKWLEFDTPPEFLDAVLEWVPMDDTAARQLVGITLSKEPCTAWMIGALVYLLRDLGVEIEEIQYGTPDHHSWNGIVRD